MSKAVRFRLALEWFQNPDHLPFLIGLDQGWFEHEGIALELVEPKEHLDANAMFERGELDAAITEPIHLVGDAASNTPIRGFGRFLHTNGGVLYFGGTGIERPRDLAGKRLQYPGAPGPGGLAIARTMIQRDGGPAMADITPVNNGFFHTAALTEDKADAATLAFYNFEVVEARHHGHDARFFALKDWGVPDFCQLIVTAPAAKLEAERERYQRFIKVLRRGIDFAIEHAERARTIYGARSKDDLGETLTRAIYDATVPCLTHDLSMAPAYYERLSTWMLETGQIEQAVRPEQVWTNAFALA